MGCRSALRSKLLWRAAGPASYVLAVTKIRIGGVQTPARSSTLIAMCHMMELTADTHLLHRELLLAIISMTNSVELSSTAYQRNPPLQAGGRLVNPFGRCSPSVCHDLELSCREAASAVIAP